MTHRPDAFVQAVMEIASQAEGADMTWYVNRSGVAAPFYKSRAFVGPYRTRFEDVTEIFSATLTDQEIISRAPTIYPQKQITGETT